MLLELLRESYLGGISHFICPNYFRLRVFLIKWFHNG